ncbi:MAG: ChaN family lipoprotein [bacterium]
MRRVFLFRVLCLSLPLVLGSPSPVPAQSSGSERPVFDTARETFITAGEMMGRLREADVVYVGETHTDHAHHLAQREVLEALDMGPRRVVMAWEMFHASQQPLLDAYTGGWLPEVEWRDAIYWEHTWGHPYPYYTPLLDYAREHAVRIFGLNAPRSVVRAVRTEGEENIGEDEAYWLPAGFWDRILRDEEAEYRTWFEQAAAAHGAEPDSAFEAGMFASQTAWNEIMAWNVVKVFNVVPDEDLQVLVVVGSGHAIFGQGIPTRVPLFMEGLDQVVVMPRTGDVMTRDQILEEGMEAEGDYLWFVPPAEEPPGVGEPESGTPPPGPPPK